MEKEITLIRIQLKNTSASKYKNNISINYLKISWKKYILINANISLLLFIVNNWV